jgi:hypothetical protein
MNGKLPSLFACFLPYCDSHQENVGKKIGRKIFPEDSKRMRPVQIFGILAVRELPFHLRYCSFGSLMQYCKIFSKFVANTHDLSFKLSMSFPC